MTLQFSFRRNRTTIAAIATAVGPGGISVIRVSGAESQEVARRLCPDLPPDPSPRRAYYSRFVSPDDGTVLDEGLVLLFRRPSSFTGEDVAELHGHGGIAQPRALFDAALAAGCEAAGPGEFSRRAVENGKMDLARAEGIAELVAAETEAGLRRARSLLGGALSSRVERMLSSIEDLLAELEGSIDFPEEMDGLEEEGWCDRAESLEEVASELADGWRRASHDGGGPRVALVGPANSGKSSLLNSLSRFERAIVDSSPGTTRDLLEARVSLDRETITIVDGAGFRDRPERIESVGIEMIEQAARQADLVIGVLDASRPARNEGRRALSFLSNLEGPLLVAANKVDLGTAGLEDIERALSEARCSIVSAKTGAGIEELRKAVEEVLFDKEAGESEVVVMLERHHRAVRAAARALGRAREALASNGAPELACEELREARAALSEIVGRGALAETLLDRIFDRFCIGK